MNNKLLLNFICKDEAKNIERMLESAQPWIVGCVCTDTGSTDDTPFMIEAFFRAHNKPCIITHEPFIDYSQARNAALRAARASGIGYDYLLFLDCDHELMVAKEGLLELEAAAYNVIQEAGQLRFTNIRLLRQDMPIEYVGRTHEALILPDDIQVWGMGDDILWVRDHETGPNRNDKFERDMRLLELDFADDPQNPRTLFYLAQTLRGAARYAESREWSAKRIAMLPQNEEVWWSMLSSAQCGDMLELDAATVSREYLMTFLFSTKRAEPLYYLGAYHRRHEEYQLAILYSRAAALMPNSREAFITDKNVCEWLALDDWLALALILDMGADARHAAKMLKDRKIPDNERERIKNNLALVEKL